MCLSVCMDISTITFELMIYDRDTWRAEVHHDTVWAKFDDQGHRSKFNVTVIEGKLLPSNC